MNYFEDTYGILSIPLAVLLEAEAMDLIIDAVKQGNTDRESIRAYFASITPDQPRDGYF